jgi:hypothetical protein
MFTICFAASSNDVVMPAMETKANPVVAEEVTTVANALVKVYPSGKIKLVDEAGHVIGRARKKGRKTVKRLGKK